MALRIHNTLTRTIEEVAPRKPGVVTLYTCGPTVYRSAHIGNLRSYLMADWLRRALQHQGFQVRHVKNITDVGHMRQEMLERGEDKVIAAAIAEGKTPQEIAQSYTGAFFRDEARLNILPAHVHPRATEHIPEMLAIIQELVRRGHAYERSGNWYFSVASFPSYGRLSGNLQASLQGGARGEVDPLKQDPRDFTLWKAAEPGRSLKWPSPWGDGFPGWHIECSAMSMKYLGPQIDIHTGGVDNIFPHHEGEIAQSEGATGVPFVRYWVHGQHLLADGVKMAKSVGNAYTLGDLEQRGFDPLSFRYLCLTARFNARLNFTFSALRAAEQALARLRHRVWEWSLDGWEASPSSSPGPGTYGQAFWQRVEDNLDLPGALSTLWAVVRSELPAAAKLSLLLEFDQVLGLGLAETPAAFRVPPPVAAAMEGRRVLRLQTRYGEADALRDQAHHQGYRLEDTRSGTQARPLSPLERRRDRWSAVSSSREVPSLLGEPDAVEFSLVVVCDYLQDVQRCLDSALRSAGPHSLEMVAVDDGSTDETAAWLAALARQDRRVRVVHADHPLGEAAARNIGLKQSLGRIIVMLDPSAEVMGDLFIPVARHLQDATVGVVGPFGLYTHDLREFREVSHTGDVDAMQSYCFAFRRALLAQVGLLPESFRYYRNLDLYASFLFRDRGYRILADPSLPVRRHEHRLWLDLSDEERKRLSRDNFRRFLRRWGQRRDLLVTLPVG
ncbi:MAG: cysteine--tRNA ligase [Chloroflexi bacterium]|nr:cysteine--tRNA ligase [Chloroflexota bacterium]